MPDVTILVLVALLVTTAVAALRARARCTELQADLAAATATTDALRAAADRERELAQARIAEMVASREQMLEQFKAASADALSQSGATFMQLARAEFERSRVEAASDLEARQRHIDELVRPIEATLKQVDQRIETFDRGRAETASSLKEHMKLLAETGTQLRSETSNLTRALRQPIGRGQWGELQLRRVVEMAGLAEHCCDFSTQHATLDAEARRLRPDMVVNLPNGRCVVIDAKTPLDAFLDAAEAPDDESAAPHLERHAEQVRSHMRLLASKQYARSVDGALTDLVVLFLPAEHLFAAAVRVQPGLVEDAFARGIIIASPTTLLTLLHAVAQGWKEERLARNADEIAQLGRELHERVATMASHFEQLGRHLDKAGESYNKTVRSMETRVLATTRKFEKLDAASGKDLPEPAAVTIAAQPVAAPEFVAELAPGRDDSTGHHVPRVLS